MRALLPSRITAGNHQSSAFYACDQSFERREHRDTSQSAQRKSLVLKMPHDGSRVSQRSLRPFSALSAVKLFSPEAKTTLQIHPMPNATELPISTHQVQGSDVFCHRYNSTPNPQTIPMVVPN